LNHFSMRHSEVVKCPADKAGLLHIDLDAEFRIYSLATVQTNADRLDLREEEREAEILTNMSATFHAEEEHQSVENQSAEI